MYSRGSCACATVDTDRKATAIQRNIDDLRTLLSPLAHDGDSSASVVGTWTVTALEGTDGKAVSIDDYATANGVDPETLKCTYTFADDGTFSGEMSGVTVSGNYTFEGTDLVMTVGEQQFNYTYDADNDMLKYTDPNTGLSSYCERQQ